MNGHDDRRREILASAYPRWWHVENADLPTRKAAIEDALACDAQAAS